MGKDDGEGFVVGADFGFFRLEVEGTYQDGKATNLGEVMLQLEEQFIKQDFW